MMRIIIDIGHPAHVHLFKHFAWLMQEKGNKILFTVRDKEHEIYLLKNYGFDYNLIGKHYKSKLGKILGLVRIEIKLLKIALEFKPDVFLSHGSFYAAHVGWLLRKTVITLEDTGNMEQVRLYLPFTSAVLTSNVFHKELGNKQIRYKGYHELAYLHPSKFTSNGNIKEKIGVQKKEKLILLRFVSWNATHDIGENGLSLENKRLLISKLNGDAKVFISSEDNLDSEFEKYKINITPEQIHDVLAEVDLYIGEGATIASECSMLATPAIYINTIEAGTINDQENHGLLFHFRNFLGVIEKSFEILNNPDSKNYFASKRDKMLKDKINVTSFLIWFVENYPSSFKVMRDNPDFQDRFI
jgi:uncharacterized protein